MPAPRLTLRSTLTGAAALAAWLTGAPAAQVPPNWPSFRGPAASGVASGQDLPDAWNGESGDHVAWRTPISGLAHSSPIVWGDRVFVTTAVSSRGDATFKPGLYGEGTASEDRSPQQWKLLALDARTGQVRWERTAYEGVPREKRHIKNTYASSTPATDGRYVIAFFGSQGLYAYTVDGELAWKKDLGRLDLGAYDAPDYGDIFVVRAGRDFALLGKNPMGETLMATPAITGGTLFVRGERHVFAIRR